jgi:hypothetical protein
MIENIFIPFGINPKIKDHNYASQKRTSFFGRPTYRETAFRELPRRDQELRQITR